VALLRFHRDKRGYEYFSLVEPGGRGRGAGRLLYWFRTPPNVKLGRQPFDETVQRELESRYPGIRFDWAKILATPIPSAEDELWRERRRAVKAARLAAAAAPDEDGAAVPDDQDAAADAAEEIGAGPDEAAEDESETAAGAEGPADAGEIPAGPAETARTPDTSKVEAGEGVGLRPHKRRRRRRGGKTRRPANPTGGL
jgi:hypothetical protein